MNAVAAAVEAEERAALLGIDSSACGRRWVRPVTDLRAAHGLASGLGVPLLVAELLLVRGQTVDSAPQFLNPKLRDSMPDPFLLRDMRVAAERFCDALAKNEKIAVFGDYDVDGGTSSALLLRFARALGTDLTLYIPDRIAEGYGPNIPAMQRLAAEGHTLVVCVDCGTAALAPLTAARDAGLDVLVLDHHSAPPELPPAVAIVNANRLDETMTAQLGHCCAAGIVYLFIVAANAVLKQRGQPSLDSRQLLDWLDLVALGTVADVVPLTGLNRAYVCQGLKVMAGRTNVGLVALGEVAQVTKAPDARSLGFAYGPRVNAGGRIGDATLGARLLSTEDYDEAGRIALQLDAHNAERRALEGTVQQAAIAQLEDQRRNAPANMAFAVGEGWHPGVIGIVAARLKERFHRPSFVIAVDDKGIGKGSGRSLRGVDLGALTIAAQQAGLLLAGGGHAMAAGLTVTADQIPALQAFFEERLEGLLTPEILTPKLVVDGLLSIAALNDALLDAIDAFAPFGTGNPEPTFAFAYLTIAAARTMGRENTHVSCDFTDGSKGRLRGVAFGCAAMALGEAILDGPRRVHVAGRLSRDEYNGQHRIQLLIEDIAPAA